MIDNLEEEAKACVSARLCWRERHPKVSSMSETFALVSKLQLVQRAARCCRFLKTFKACNNDVSKTITARSFKLIQLIENDK